MAERKFNELKMYFARPFDVGNGMQIKIPTIGDILNLKDADVTFYQMLNPWTTNPTSYRLELWDLGVDWNKITDFQLFLMLYKSCDPEASQLLFGDIDLQKFDLYEKKTPTLDENGEEVIQSEVVLYNKEQDIAITEEDYTLISQYLRTAFNIWPKVEKAKGKATKQAIIEEDRMNLEFKKSNGETNDNSSPLLPLVSSCVNHPGFKYKLEELESVNFVFFMDAVQRLQIYENTTALIKGAMGGFIDGSKIKKEDLNFMRSIRAS